MKKIVLLILSILIILPSASCQKQEEGRTVESVSVRTQSGGIKDADKGEVAITIDATSDWVASPESDWLTVSPDHGSRGINEVIIHYSENTTSEERTGIIRFSAGAYSETFTLKQAKRQ